MAQFCYQKQTCAIGRCKKIRSKPSCLEKIAASCCSPFCFTIDEGGEVHVGAAEIINASTGDVIVSSVSISTKNGWQLVPYTTDMAHAKVDAKQLGFKINDSVTTKTGDAETFSLTSPWKIAENGKLPLSYDAVVSAVSQPVTEQDVLSVVFVLEWKGE